MSSVLVMLAALGCAEALGLAEMLSSYAKVATNRDVVANAIQPNATHRVAEITTEAAYNETDYEDFDEIQEPEYPRQTQLDTGTVVKFVNGLVSLLTLMYKFSDNGWDNRRVRAEPRYQPNTATKTFKYQDQEQQPISNYPPYNPLTANTADSYTQNNGQSSYDADLQEYGGKNPNPSMESDNSWNAISQDYPVYRPKKPNLSYDQWGGKPDDGHPWKTTEEYPMYAHPDEHDFILHEHPDDHHALHLPEDEDRVSKKPYSYYFLGRKLWYIPLLFSVYFIIYIGALVLKSVARHKIQFPEKLLELNNDYNKHRRYRRINDATEEYENAVVNAKYKLM